MKKSRGEVSSRTGVGRLFCKGPYVIFSALQATERLSQLLCTEAAKDGM